MTFIGYWTKYFTKAETIFYLFQAVVYLEICDENGPHLVFTAIFCKYKCYIDKLIGILHFYNNSWFHGHLAIILNDVT